MIDDFCNSFITEIKQITVNDKMKVMCTEEKFIETITHHNTETLKKKS